MPPSKVVIAPLPESLVVHPCEVVGPGNTVDSLTRGYALNTSCVGEYKITIDGIKKYNESQKELANGE